MSEITHFARLNLPQIFKQNSAEIEKNYLQQQLNGHPDLFVGKSIQEQNVALSQNMLLNEAFQIIKDPSKRATYLLSLAGINLDEGKQNAVKPSQEILIEQMEKRENLQESDSLNEISDLEKKCLAEIAYLVQNLEENFNDESQKTIEMVMRLKYENKFLEEIRKKKRR